jgi:hypothetical protein
LFHWRIWSPAGCAIRRICGLCEALLFAHSNEILQLRKSTRSSWPHRLFVTMGCRDYRPERLYPVERFVLSCMKRLTSSIGHELQRFAKFLASCHRRFRRRVRHENFRYGSHWNGIAETERFFCRLPDRPKGARAMRGRSTSRTSSTS